MKKTVLLLFALIPLAGFSQQQWQSYFKNENITIEYRYEDCHDNQNGTHKQYLLLKVSNNTDKAIDVSFRKELWYNEACTGCEGNSPEHQVQLKMKPGAKDEGTCGTSNPSLKIFSKMLDMKKSQLTKFELKNISVSPLK